MPDKALFPTWRFRVGSSGVVEEQLFHAEPIPKDWFMSPAEAQAHADQDASSGAAAAQVAQHVEDHAPQHGTWTPDDGEENGGESEPSEPAKPGPVRATKVR